MPGLQLPKVGRRTFVGVALSGLALWGAASMVLTRQAEKERITKAEAIETAVKNSHGKLMREDFSEYIGRYFASDTDLTKDGKPFCKIDMGVRELKIIDIDCGDLLAARGAFARLIAHHKRPLTYGLFPLKIHAGQLICIYSAVDTPVRCEDALVTENQRNLRTSMIRKFTQGTVHTEYFEKENIVTDYVLRDGHYYRMSYDLAHGIKTMTDELNDPITRDKKIDPRTEKLRSCIELNRAAYHQRIAVPSQVIETRYAECVKALGPGWSIDDDQAISYRVSKKVGNATLTRVIDFEIKQPGAVLSSRTTKTITEEHSPEIAGLRGVLGSYPVRLPKPIDLRS